MTDKPPHPALHRIVRYITPSGIEERAHVQEVDSHGTAKLRILGEPTGVKKDDGNGTDSVPFSSLPARGTWSYLNHPTATPSR